jgi:hypothetical protein
MNLQVANCIDEYVTTGTQRNLKFDGSGNVDVHTTVMELLAVVDNNDYHGRRLEAMLKEIPRVGR